MKREVKVFFAIIVILFFTLLGVMIWSNSYDTYAAEDWGRMRITWYNATRAQCGKADGITASGRKVREGRTCAAGRQFAFGTRIYIDGLGEYIVEDRGVPDFCIDIYCEDYQKAKECGLQHRNVYVIGRE